MGLRGHRETQLRPSVISSGCGPWVLRCPNSHRRVAEYGKGTKANPNDALVSYLKAAKAGDFLAYAFMAKLISKTAHYSKAEPFWRKFFDALA